MLYRCYIRGENFPGQLIGRKGLVGFYTTRWVEAASAEEAELLGLEMLKSDPTFEIKSLKLRQQSKAKVYFEEIVPVKEPHKGFGSGATWFEI